MTTRRAPLGELETLTLLAVLRLKEEASARRIREEVGERGGRSLSRGATYATLRRLEKKGFLEVEEAPAASTGPAAHRFALTSLGLETLRQAQRNLARMRDGLEYILDAT